jgi:hypothetical protein
LRSYIQCWSIIKNSADNISDERAIDAFALGLRRSDLVEELGRIKPRTVSEQMEIANKFADGEDAYHNNLRRRTRNDDSHSTCNQVAAGHRKNSEEGGERRNNDITERMTQGETSKETLTRLQRTSSMDLAIYITHILMPKETSIT